MIDHKAPSRQGSSNGEDCLVIETYFELARRLRQHGATAPCVFMSSNIKDYASHGALHDDLEDEFQALNMHYAVNFGAARNLLGLK